MMRRACQEVQKQWVEIHSEKLYLLWSENHEKKNYSTTVWKLIKIYPEGEEKQDKIIKK